MAGLVYTDTKKLEDQAASTALSSSQKEPQRRPSILDEDGKLSSASAATSLKYAKAQDLPSFPSAGLKMSSAGAAATLADSNKKNFEHWKPGAIPAANRAALLAKDYEMDPLWQPEMSAAGSKAAILAHKDTESPEIWKSQGTAQGQSAAGQAVKAKMPNAITDRNVPADSHRKAMLAATGAMANNRARSGSLPSSKGDSKGDSKSWALKAATTSHQGVSNAGPFGPGDPGFEASRIQNAAKSNVNRQMYGSTPPVALEVEEKNRQDMLRASAVAMAKKMYAIQQTHIDEAAGLKRSDSQAAATSSHQRDRSDSVRGTGDDLTTGQGHRYENLEEAARKLAQERLAKLHDEHAEYRQYYGAAAPAPSTRSRLSMRLRRRASVGGGEADDSDDEEQSRRIKTQMSLFQSKVAEVDVKKRQADRDAVLQAAHRNVEARMAKMDEKVFQETGKASPAQLQLWEQQARERAQKNSDTRMENHGKVHIGGGKYLDQAEIDAIARARLQPTLDEISETAERQRARDEEIRIEAQRAQEQIAKEKARQAEIKAEAKAAQEVEKAEAKKKKDEEKRKKDEEKQAEKEKAAAAKEQSRKEKEEKEAVAQAEKARARAEKDRVKAEAAAAKEQSKKEKEKEQANKDAVVAVEQSQAQIEKDLETERLKAETAAAKEEKEKEQAEKDAVAAVEDAKAQVEKDKEMQRQKAEIAAAKEQTKKEKEEAEAIAAVEQAKAQVEKDAELEVLKAEAKQAKKEQEEKDAIIAVEQAHATVEHDREIEHQKAEAAAAKEKARKEQEEKDAIIAVEQAHAKVEHDLEKEHLKAEAAAAKEKARKEQEEKDAIAAAEEAHAKVEHDLEKEHLKAEAAAAKEKAKKEQAEKDAIAAVEEAHAKVENDHEKEHLKAEAAALKEAKKKEKEEAEAIAAVEETKARLERDRLKAEAAARAEQSKKKREEEEAIAEVEKIRAQAEKDEPRKPGRLNSILRRKHKDTTHEIETPDATTTAQTGSTPAVGASVHDQVTFNTPSTTAGTSTARTTTPPDDTAAVVAAFTAEVNDSFSTEHTKKDNPEAIASTLTREEAPTSSTKRESKVKTWFKSQFGSGKPAKEDEPKAAVPVATDNVDKARDESIRDVAMAGKDTDDLYDAPKKYRDEQPVSPVRETEAGTSRSSSISSFSTREAQIADARPLSGTTHTAQVGRTGLKPKLMKKVDSDGEPRQSFVTATTEGDLSDGDQEYEEASDKLATPVASSTARAPHEHSKFKEEL